MIQEPREVPAGLSLAETVQQLRLEHNRLVSYVKRVRPKQGINIELSETTDGTIINGRPGNGTGNNNEPRWL